MTRQEFAKVVATLKTVFGEEDFIKTQQAFDVWYELLKDIDYRRCMMAAQQYMQTEHFPPKPADLRRIMAGQSVVLKDYGDAWQEVLLAVRKYGYYREQDALESMDELTRRAVQNLGWQNICLSENPMTDRSNFRMIYEQLSAREKERNTIAPALMQQIERARIEGTVKPLLEVGA